MMVPILRPRRFFSTAFSLSVRGPFGYCLTAAMIRLSDTIETAVFEMRCSVDSRLFVISIRSRLPVASTSFIYRFVVILTIVILTVVTHSTINTEKITKSFILSHIRIFPIFTRHHSALHSL